MDKEPLVELVELDQRRGDSMLVTLWWVKNTLETYVELVDLKTQPPSVTEIPVQPPASPNDVFNHPFRYIPDSPTVELSR
jgi:hypothetical protein